MTHATIAQPTAPGDPGNRLSIVKIETLVVNAQLRNWVFVKVVTSDDGLYGWGEASLNWKTQAVIGAIRDLTPLLVGTDPRDIVRALEIMNKHSYYRLGIIGTTAISGIEHALWDILGKTLGVPVWKLLGGRVRDRVHVYTHLGLGEMTAVYKAFDPSKVGDGARKIVELGYDALKVVIVPYGGYTATKSGLDLTYRLMNALRHSVGTEVDIMVDFHGRPASIGAAMEYLNVLAPFHPMFCEEPVAPGDTEAMKRVAVASTAPIAAGERLVGLPEFVPLLAEKAVDIAQPDLNHTGGLIEGKKIAALAAAQLIGIAPHNPNGPIAGAAALHFDVSTPNFVIQEEMSGAVPWYDDVISSTPVSRAGSYWSVPTSPGLGVEINEVEAARHPFMEEHIHSRSAVLQDGTIASW